MPDPEEENQLMPASEQFYLYRVEMYLIHKYRPEMVDELKISFARARARREGVLKHDENIIRTREELLQRIQNDIISTVPWKPKNSSHKRSSVVRPGIGGEYQRQFEEL